MIDSIGNVIHSKCFGGSAGESAASIDLTNESGFYIGGVTSSCDGDVTGCIGNSDYWIVKTDSNLNVIWQRVLGGTENEDLKSLKSTNDGGVILAGISNSNDVDVIGQHGCSGCSDDFWIVKLDSSGNLQWQKTLGSIYYDQCSDICLANDGGYVLVGNVELDGGDVSGTHGHTDYWVVKIDSLGQFVWQHCFGGTLDEQAISVISDRVGGYFVSGGSMSNDGDVTNNHGYFDTWVVKIDSLGQIVWQNSFGGSNSDYPVSMKLTESGGLIILSETLSDDGEVTGFHGLMDNWLICIDSLGNLLWQKCLGGSYFDHPASVVSLDNSDILISGYSNSFDGDVTGNHGGLNCFDPDSCFDAWIVKLGFSTGIDKFVNDTIISIYPNPLNSVLNLDNLKPGELISIYTGIGVKIMEFRVSSTFQQISFAGYSNGLYYIKTEYEPPRLIIKM